jgi:hypothetical protein
VYGLSVGKSFHHQKKGEKDIAKKIQWENDLDQEGREHLRSTGFMPPEELIPRIFLARGKVHFDRQVFHEATVALDHVISAHPESQAVPAAVYYRAVTQ